ncbi:MAG: DUF2452 domain-containing protein [Myxococcales bacterium]
MSDDEQAPERGTQQRPFAGPGRAAPYALSRLAGPVSLVDVAREIEHADAFIASTTDAQLRLIAEQMAALRSQAERLLEQARVNAELHRAEARFVRHPGKTYHLYARPHVDGDEVRYWSLLAPADWGGQPPHRFLGSYRLESDQSWTPLDAQDSGARRPKVPKMLPDP